MSKKVLKKKEVSSLSKPQFQLKIVTSESCEKCKSQCSRGIRYMLHMRTPGSIGQGVPCILTRWRK